ncbi:hypothetical protein GCM10025879_15980 [Leuconostoc litchii]|uniref:hypothetical protein n=1 Tax=Leuconostoc litchii TaxID=1981069 RepID=UPI0023E9780E|nr:hypothetical protein [Leuconostoc litchii]GMA70352.1 hypothetical protein GCM10025879_15980 [Leuconostoc litchii]
MNIIFLGIEACLLLLTIFCYFLGKKYHILKQSLIIIYIVTTAIYLIWRTGWTLPNDNVLSLILGIILLLAELGDFVCL